MAKGRSKPVPIGEVLTKVLDERGLGGTGAVGKLRSGWEGAVGGRVSSHAWPETLRGGVLTLVVDNSVWMNQLSMLQDTIIEQANSLFGKELVTDVRFRLGKVEAPGAKRKDAAPFVPKRRKVTGAEDAAIDEAVRPIKDAEVREKARRLLLSACSRKAT